MSSMAGMRREDQSFGGHVAIYRRAFLSRRARRELVAFGQDKATLNLQFYSEEREQEAELTIQNGRRSAALQRRAEAFSGRIGR